MRYLRLLTIVALLAACRDNTHHRVSSSTGDLVVFAASSLTEPFTAIGARLEATVPGLHVIFHFAGSATLRTQLEQGARADVFASADKQQMALAQQHAVVQSQSILFARNTLTVIVPTTNPGGISSFRDLAQPGLKIALAAPHVPVGNYSRLCLQAAGKDYGDDFAEQVLRNVVSEESNVKQVVAKVQLGEVDAGIVYVSDVSPSMNRMIHSVPIPVPYNQEAEYPLALTTQVQNQAAAEAFVQFVLSAEGQGILKAHRFLPAPGER